MSQARENAAGRVLVVDDDEVVRLHLRGVLEGQGYEVTEAENGALGVERACQGDFDVVLLDVQMPVMDGIQACHQIKRRLAGDFLPVVFVTSLDDTDSRQQGLGVGADEFLTKPVDQVELLARVRNLVRLRRLHQPVSGGVELPASDILEGRYRLLRVVGRGGMGTVYLARHLRIGRDVAIKTVDLQNRDAAAIRQLEREARTVALLGHPHIVETLDFGLTSGGAYLVMEYLLGTDLAHVLRDEGPLPLAEACRLMLQVASALEYAHESGVIHRDIKPGNIFLCESETGPRGVKLLDFGLAGVRRVLAQDVGSEKVEEVLGTPAYMAPEQITSWFSVDGRADVYSLGVTLYAVLCGESPFAADYQIATISKSLHEAPKPISTRVPNLPCANLVDQFLDQALQKHPDARMPSMRAFRAGLTQIQGACNGNRVSIEVSSSAQRRSRSAFSAWVTHIGGQTVIELSGCIGEMVDFEGMLARVDDTSHVSVKLARIQRINSVGHARWVEWLRSLAQGGRRVELHECAPVLVRQGNVDPEFFAELPVVSFYAPFYCHNCDAEREILRVSERVRSAGLKGSICELCGGPMVFDDIEETYLAFLSQ